MAHLPSQSPATAASQLGTGRFPASDQVSVEQPTTSGRACRSSTHDELTDTPTLERKALQLWKHRKALIYCKINVSKPSLVAMQRPAELR
jgi:hypothetical protein